MTTTDLLLQTFRTELPVTHRILERVLDDRAASPSFTSASAT